MKRITGEEIRNMYGPAPEDLAENLRRAIDKEKRNGKEERTMSKKTMVCIALAAVLLIGALTALASTGFSIFRLNEDASGIQPLADAGELVKQNLASAEDEYVKISVEEALFDGQSFLAVYRLTPKDSENYVLFNNMIQDYDPEVFDVNYNVPVPVKDEDMLKYKEDGETEFDVPTYEKDGQLYYADFFAIEATRTDGKTVIDYSLLSTASSLGIDGALESAAHGDDGELFMDSFSGEEQSDGSLLLLVEGRADSFVTSDANVETKLIYSLDGFETRREVNLSFKLQNDSRYKDVHLTFEDPNGERFTLLEGKIHFTPLYGYMTLTYEYEEAAGEEMGITFRVYDANGERIRDGEGYADIIGQNGERQVIIEMTELQSFDDVPKTLILEAKVIGEDKTLGRVTCSVVED